MAYSDKTRGMYTDILTGIKDAGLANRLTLGDLRGLAEFELLDEQIDLLLAVAGELGLPVDGTLANDVVVVVPRRRA